MAALVLPNGLKVLRLLGNVSQPTVFLLRVDSITEDYGLCTDLSPPRLIRNCPGMKWYYSKVRVF